MRLALIVFALALALCALAPPAPAQSAADFKDLLSRVPDSANAIVIMDVEGLVKSDLGIKERWASKHSSEFMNGAMIVPPSASKAVLGAKLGEGEEWVVGVIPTKRNVNMKDVAKDEKSEVESLAETNAVFSKRNAYFVELGPKLLGIMAPANRQEVGRWLRTTKRTRAPGLSRYLMDAVDWPRNGQILMAIDLQDMLDPKAVRNWLSHAKQLEDKRGEIDKVSTMLGQLRGAKFLVRVTDTIKGQLYLDFNDKLDPKDAQLLKPVLIAGLEELGVAIDEVKNGKGSVEGRSVIVDADLTPKAVRRILSIIHLPAPSHNAVAETPTDEDPAATASRRYYNSVQQMIGELKEMAERSNYSGSLVIKWYETYARKIDQLPLLNVDQELLQYGAAIAEKLRQYSLSLSGQKIQGQVLDSYKRQEVYGYGGAYAGYGYGGAYAYGGRGIYRNTNYKEVQSAKNENIAKGVNERNQIWQSIDKDTADVRRAMTEKYRVEFGSAN